MRGISESAIAGKNAEGQKTHPPLLRQSQLDKSRQSPLEIYQFGGNVHSWEFWRNPRYCHWHDACVVIVAMRDTLAIHGLCRVPKQRHQSAPAQAGELRLGLPFLISWAWASALLISVMRRPKASRSAVLALAASMLLIQRQRLPHLVNIWRISSIG